MYVQFKSFSGCVFSLVQVCWDLEHILHCFISGYNVLSRDVILEHLASTSEY